MNSGRHAIGLGHASVVQTREATFECWICFYCLSICCAFWMIITRLIFFLHRNDTSSKIQRTGSPRFFSIVFAFAQDEYTDGLDMHASGTQYKLEAFGTWDHLFGVYFGYSEFRAWKNIWVPHADRVSLDEAQGYFRNIGWKCVKLTLICIIIDTYSRYMMRRWITCIACVFFPQRFWSSCWLHLVGLPGQPAAQPTKSIAGLWVKSMGWISWWDSGCWDSLPFSNSLLGLRKTF